jgi:hypothetical protein
MPIQQAQGMLPGKHNSAVFSLLESLGQAIQVDRRKGGKWSPRTDLNRRPADYKSAALPLSYVGVNKKGQNGFALFYYHITIHGST